MIWRSAVVATTLTLSACGIAPASTPPASSSAAIREVTVTEVADGDTIKVTSPDGAETKIRILGIDAPETKDPRRPVGCFGPESSQFATRTLLGQIVTLEPDPTQGPTDRFGRSLFYVDLPGGRDFSVLAAEAGMARSYIYDRPPQRIAAIQAAERRAVNARRGVWSDACLTKPTR